MQRELKAHKFTKCFNGENFSQGKGYHIKDRTGSVMHTKNNPQEKNTKEQANPSYVCEPPKTPIRLKYYSKYCDTNISQTLGLTWDTEIYNNGKQMWSILAILTRKYAAAVKKWK